MQSLKISVCAIAGQNTPIREDTIFTRHAPKTVAAVALGGNRGPEAQPSAIGSLDGPLLPWYHAEEDKRASPATNRRRPEEEAQCTAPPPRRS